MNPKEKEARILEIQANKEIFLEQSRAAYKRKVAAYNGYLKLNSEWSVLRDQYEALDREEKLLEFSLKNLPTAKTKTLKKNTGDKVKQFAEAKAKAAMASLPPEVLAKILAQLKS